MPEDKPLFPMRINKYLAWKKHSTRRGADELIERKQVFVNGQLATLGAKVNETDSVEVRFRGKVKPYVYMAYHKPKGLVSFATGAGQKDIHQSVGGHSVAMRDVFPVGHLDKEAHGLIILTNDGRITAGLLDSDTKHEKEFVVVTREPLRTSFKANMEKGVHIEGALTKPCHVTVKAPDTFKIILTENRKHQIRRMCSALFQEVTDIHCIRIMNITLGKLAENSHRKIEGDELVKFLAELGINQVKS